METKYEDLKLFVKVKRIEHGTHYRVALGDIDVNRIRKEPP